MKYAIAHVLEGIQYHRMARLNSKMEAVATLKADLAKTQARREEAPTSLARLLQEHSIHMNLLHTVERSDYDALRSTITRHERGTATQYDVDSLARKVEQLQEQADYIAREAETQDTPLEQFLRALQDGGETTVSQYGIKQAGFKAERITDYIVARLHGQASADG